MEGRHCDDGVQKEGGWVIISIWLWGCQLNEPEAKVPDVSDSIEVYSKQPTYLQPIFPKSVPTGLSSLSSASCGECHTEIYNEWSISTHSYAWTDLQFQAELKKPTQNGGNVEWMCVRCHTPYWDQLPQLVVDLSKGLDFAATIPNPMFDSELREEGVGCISCHLGEGVILGPTGTANAPHPVQKSEALLKPEACNTCHQAEAYFPDQNLACVFSTGEEHAASPQWKDGQSCQSCHMPTVERPTVSGGPVKSNRRHFFGGSRIPKSKAHAKDIEQMAEYYKHGLNVSIQPFDPSNPVLRIDYENANAGHMLPAGDPERFIRIYATVTDSNDRVVAHRELKIGSIYQWYPTVKLLSDNRLAPKEKRSIEIDLSFVDSGVFDLKVKAEKWRITEENLVYHELENKLPSHVSFLNLDEKITIP